MSNSNSIEVRGVSKKYCKNLKKSIIYGLTDITRGFMGLPQDSFRLRREEFWALNNVSFTLKRGESIGIIGPNGSGKSTLLKLLNGIFMPDKGTIMVKGKVGALIEVGAGFHPMLTGRENIYINGAILGITKKEIDRKFKEIVNFAEIGDFLDVPVKSYSSGMFVRLGFAIAVHCEPDILLVDEVLAVGDSVFINKCYQKINEIKKRNKVTIVLVSHNLLTIEKFCDTGIFLNQGKIKSRGEIHHVIRDYQKLVSQLLDKQENIIDIPGIPYCTKEIEITNVAYLNQKGREQKEFSSGDSLRIRVEYKTNSVISNPIFQISLFNRQGVHVSVFGTHIDKIWIKSIQGKGVIECRIENLPLLLNKYFINVAVYDKTHNITFDYWNGSMKNKYFRVSPDIISQKMAEYTPICKLSADWEIKK